MRETIARVIDWFRRDRLDRELRDELQFHEQQLLRDEISSGTEPNLAPSVARKRIGNLTNAHEAARDRWSIPWMDSLQQDIRYAVRGLSRNLGFTTVVVLTLALGLGANAAVFSLLGRLFLQTPSGVPSADALRRIYVTQFGNRAPRISDRYNYPELQDLRSAIPEIPNTAYATDSISFENASSSRFVTATFTDANYWKTLDVTLGRGRPFSNDEARIEVPGTVAIVSHRFWKRFLHGSSDLNGVQVQLNGKRYDVIGVGPEAFEGLDLGATDVWLPLGAMPLEEFDPGRFWYSIRSDRRLQLVARQPLSVTAAALDARLTASYRAGSIAGGYAYDSTAVVQSGSIIAARGPLTRGTEQVIATRLAWVSVLVLLIACANVANLLLTRLTERQREIAVRLALGVSRARLARQFFAELMVLAGVSLVAALVAGNWAGSLLRTSLLPGVRWSGAALDTQSVIGIAAGTLLITIVLAFVPIAHIRQFGATDALRNGQRASSRNGGLRATLVIGQTALAVVLLSGAMLCVESLRRVMAVRVGYDVGQVAFAIPRLMGERGGESFDRNTERVTALREAGDQLSRDPSVENIAYSSHSPIGGFSMMSTRVFGSDSEPKLNGMGPMVRDVSPEYGETVGLRLLSGRFFTRTDVSGTPLVTVINESMARVAWPGQNPLGQCLTFYRTNVCREVVGVVQDAHLSSVVEEPTMQAFLPLEQGGKTGGPTRPSVLIVRAAPGQMPNVLAKTTSLLSAALPNSDLRLQTLEQRVERDYRPWRLGAFLFGMLASLGLLVASIGLYGVIAYGVRRRTHEIGIRAALGAGRSRVVLMVVQNGVATVAIGSTIGIGAAVGLSRYASSLFYETSMNSPLILGGIVTVMLCTAVLASMIPAWQAGRVSPMTALRSE